MFPSKVISGYKEIGYEGIMEQGKKIVSKKSILILSETNY
jgi:hypothetical protein